MRVFIGATTKRAAENDPSQLWKAVAVSSTNTIGPVIVSADNQVNLSFDVSWTGTPTGTFKIEASNSFRMVGATVVQSGSWTDITSACNTFFGFSNPAGGASNTAICIPSGLVFAAYRISYTNSSGSGTMSAWFKGF